MIGLQSLSPRTDGWAASHNVVIEAVTPQIECGRFPTKAILGDSILVEADIFSEGHGVLNAALLYRVKGARNWQSEPMRHFGNDRWRARFTVSEVQDYEYTIEAWPDVFNSWRHDLRKKIDAGVDIHVDLLEGCDLIERITKAAKGDDRQTIQDAFTRASTLRLDPVGFADLLLSQDLSDTIARCAPRSHVTRFERNLVIRVDRPAARFSAWYELFPRSQGPSATRHGTFKDVIARLPYIQDLGFDVLYFPPIHPIGEINRKGRNNNLTAQAGEPGSPYAIGSRQGGHTDIHPELGTLDDFQLLVKEAHAHGLELAMDFAIQCAPDHPWIKAHPEWFDWRPDGTIKYAENPPKKYEDIVNLKFYGDAFPGVWHALRDVVLFWLRQGVRIFRVDNPHTKPFPFWEWLIAETRRVDPGVLFLAEAFTRPKIMKRLAKLGFNQSYTYFTWRNTKAELTEYLTELSSPPEVDYYRPNFFVNTPDINPYFLQTSGRPGFVIRATLAATLSPSYGIYNGFEICEAEPVPGKEEYLDSEKYQLRHFDMDRPGNIVAHLRALNAIRRANPALERLDNLRFYNAFNDNILLYGKMTPQKDNALLIAVNLDPQRAQSGNFEIPLWEFGLSDDQSLDVENLLDGTAFRWTGKVQSVTLNPQENPCAIWRIRPVAASAP